MRGWVTPSSRQHRQDDQNRDGESRGGHGHGQGSALDHSPLPAMMAASIVAVDAKRPANDANWATVSMALRGLGQASRAQFGPHALGREENRSRHEVTPPAVHVEPLVRHAELCER